MRTTRPRAGWFFCACEKVNLGYPQSPRQPSGRTQEWLPARGL